MRITQAYEMINSVVFPYDYKLCLHLTNCVAHRHWFVNLPFCVHMKFTLNIGFLFAVRDLILSNQNTKVAGSELQAGRWNGQSTSFTIGVFAFK